MGRKGKGCIYKQSGRFYFQMRANGARKVVPLEAEDAKAADLEAEKYRKIWSSDRLDELSYHVANARKLLANGSDMACVWPLYIQDQARPDSGEGTLANYKTQWNAFTKWRPFCSLCTSGLIAA